MTENPIDQLRDEIANLHLLADRLASAKPHTPTLEECEQAFHEAYGNALRPGINLAGLAAVRDLFLASRSPSHELVEAADAMRETFERVWRDYAAGPCDEIDAYDSARARHAEGAQPSGAPAPASAQGEVMPGQDNDGVWIDTTPPSSEKTGEERK